MTHAENSILIVEVLFQAEIIAKMGPACQLASAEAAFEMEMI